MIYAAVLRKNVVYGIENETNDSCADRPGFDCCRFNRLRSE